MSYGKFDKSIVNHLNKVTYTLDGTSYSNMMVFKTDPKTESVAPAVYLKGNKQLMENMYPRGITNVIAKTNAGAMAYGKDTSAFAGLYYQDGVLYKDNEIMTGTSDNRLNDLHPRYYPCFCVKKDGTANIRWPRKDNLQGMLNNCDCVIAALEPLVYNGISVFEEAVYDPYGPNGTSVRIADVNDLDNENYRYEDYYCGTSTKNARNRTFFGHKSDGSFLMVCTNSATMDLITGAKMMVDLGCDFAVNEDGASTMKMRVATGYSGTETPGQVTVGGTNYYGAAICAYKK